eukprot:TRINITY_DN3068_c0_g2_i1.p1 TRINITY_DN3068_c0_g2~~TRINITY_DN3068_c0_g2_i1.p1  ORF type:complete len:530 (+),score=60.49 TRINITY_DN3068_c0_g2_i1:116-1705(+)
MYVRKNNQVLKQKVLNDIESTPDLGKQLNKLIEVNESQEQDKNCEDRSGAELLSIAINLGNGKEEHLMVYEGDNPQEVTDAFCLKHSLNLKQRMVLITQIKTAMEEELRSRLNVEGSEIIDDDIDEHNGDAMANIPIMSAKPPKSFHDPNAASLKGIFESNVFLHKGSCGSKDRLLAEAFSHRKSENDMGAHIEKMHAALVANFLKIPPFKSTSELKEDRSDKQSDSTSIEGQRSASKETREGVRNWLRVGIAQRRCKKQKCEAVKNWQVNHPFQPRATHKRSISEKHTGSVRFIQLFEDAKRRKILKEKSNEVISDIECTFSPNTYLTQEFNKAIIPRHSLRKNVTKSSHCTTDEIDANTGKPLYRPQTGRPSKTRSKSRTESIGNYLHNLSKVSSTSRIEESPNISFIQPKSNKMVENMRRSALEMIFNILDGDRDGVISGNAVNTKKLPIKIKEIFEPLLKEMEEMKCGLDMEEFIDAANNLFKELTVMQNSAFIEYYKSVKTQKRRRRNSTQYNYSFQVSSANYL